MQTKLADFIRGTPEGDEAESILRACVQQPWLGRAHASKMLVLDGCVQPSLAPNINAAAARVLDAVGVQLIAAP